MTDETARLGSIAKLYGRHVAVDGVDLGLCSGESVALVGHNGAGKSTLIKLMLGLIRPTRGTVRVLGEDPAAGRAARSRREIGYLPENVAFQPSLTGAEILAFYARLKHQPVSRNAELLERVGIAHAADRRVGTYSKGMRQRLGLAQALLGQPRLLLLDEPTTGLDPDLRRGFYDIMRMLRESGATVLLSSHALAELEAHVDRVIVLHRGRKVADGTIRELRHAAGLPTRLKLRAPPDRIVKMAAALSPPATWRLLAPDTLVVSCAEAEKMQVLRQIGGAPMGVTDIEMELPTLADIYQAIVDRRAPEVAEAPPVPGMRERMR